MIYDYVNTKPPLDEVYSELEHGWLKDQAAKVHKYIKRWKTKAGRWAYLYAKNKEKLNQAKKDLNEFYNDPKKQYVLRKFQIKKAKNNAHKNYIATSTAKAKKAYKSRSSKVKQARQNASNAYTSRMNKAKQNATNTYKDRINQIRKSRRKTASTYPYRKTIIKTIKVNRRFW